MQPRTGFRSQLKALSSTFDLDTPLKAILHKDQWPQVWVAIRAEVGQPEWPASIPWPGLLTSGPKTVRELNLACCCIAADAGYRSGRGLDATAYSSGDPTDRWRAGRYLGLQPESSVRGRHRNQLAR